VAFLASLAVLWAGAASGQPATSAPVSTLPVIELAQAQQSGSEAEGEDQAESKSNLPDPDQELLKQFSSTIDVWSIQVQALDQVVNDPEATDEQLREFPGILEGMRREMREFTADLKPRLADAQARLAKLGPAAAEGEPEEASEIAEQRKSQGAEVATLDGLIKQADVLLVKVGQLIEAANTERRERFTESLLKPVANLHSQYFWRRAVANISLQFELASRAISSWLGVAAGDGLWRIALLLLAPPAVAGLIWFGAKRIVIHRAFFEPPEDGDPPLAQRAAAAILGAVKVSAPYLGALATFYLIALAAGSIAPGTDSFLFDAVLALAAAIFLISLVWRSFKPVDPDWRLVTRDASAARRLGALLTALIVIWLADRLLGLADPILYTSYPSIVLRSVVVALLTSLLLAAILFVPIGMQRENGRLSFRGWPIWLFFAVSLTIAFIVLAAAFGYVALAQFVATQVVVTGGVLVVMYLLHLTAEHISTTSKALEAQREAAETGHEAHGPSAFGAIRVLLALLMDVVLLVFGGTILLLQWGFDWVDVQTWMAAALAGRDIGGITISPTAIFGALLIFLGGLFATRIVQRWMIRRTPIGQYADIGLRESVKTGVNYVGYALSAILAIGYLGIGFTNLAIVAGALSVGIGFGLQSIFNNFVSGLILLVERPIKVGDWIEVGTYHGTVKRISVRSTEIETVHRESVIVPNANLITDVVINSMHNDKTCRVDLPVGVSYDTDVELLRKTLLEIAASNKSVLKEPAPFVYFAGYGESSLDFELRAFLRDIGRRIRVKSELRFDIWFALKDVGIQMPFPQRDLHIKDLDAIHAMGAKYARPGRLQEDEPVPPPKRRGSRAKRKSGPSGGD